MSRWNTPLSLATWYRFQLQASGLTFGHKSGCLI